MGAICSIPSKALDGNLSIKVLDVKKLCEENPYLNDLPINWPPQLRIFFSSTFDDFREERLWFFRDILPSFVDKCRTQGIEVVVVDFRTGILDSITNEHLTMDVCVEEVLNCLRTSNGLGLLGMLGDRHGYVPLPKYVEKETFEYCITLAEGSSNNIFQLLKKWYKLDLNAQPNVYTLLTISSVLPNFWEDADARMQFWNDNADILSFFQGKGHLLDKATSDIFYMSVTEAEIQTALNFSKDSSTERWIPFNNLRFFIRKFIETGEKIPAVFKSEKGADRLGALIDTIVVELPSNCVETVELPWSSRQSDDYQQKVLNWLSQVVDECYRNLCEQFSNIWSLPPHVQKLFNDLYLNNIWFQNFKSTFYCRPALVPIHEWIQSTSPSHLILSGSVGSGKTMNCSYVAKLCREQGWLIIYRSMEVGSFAIRSLLVSILHQYTVLVDQGLTDYDILNANIFVIMNALHAVMSACPIPTQKLMLVLDGLDVLDPSLTTVWYFLSYLPASESFRVCISMTPTTYQLISPHLSRIVSLNSITHVNLDLYEITVDEGWNIFKQLNRVTRTYTYTQQSSFIDAIRQVSTLSFLYIECLYQLFGGIRSFDSLSVDMLPVSEDEAIHSLLMIE